MKQAGFTNVAKSVCKIFTENLSATDTRQILSETTASLTPVPNETHSPFSRWIYTQHFGIKFWTRMKKNNYSQESSPSCFSYTVITCYPSLLCDENWKRCGGERILPVFLIVAGNPKHIWKPPIFLHSKHFTSQSFSTFLAAPQL